MKLEEIKNGSLVVLRDLRNNGERLFKIEWSEKQYKWMLTEQNSEYEKQFVIDSLGTFHVIAGYGDIPTLKQVDFFHLDAMREYKGEPLMKPNRQPEKSLTEQLNARLANANAIFYRGKRHEKVPSGYPHEWHFVSDDKLAKVRIYTHPEFRIEYEYRQPVYETIQETPSASANEFLDDNARGAFRLLGLR